MAVVARPAKLVGRRDELALLRAELAHSGNGLRCVLLVSDPGVGKSRLGGELIDQSRTKVTVMSARASPFGATSAFGLWSEALESHISRLPVSERRELGSGLPAETAALLPSLATVAPSKQRIPGQSRLRLVQGLSMLLGSIAARGRVLVFLDDIHLADASSWATLSYVARNLADRPVLLLLAGRPVELLEHEVGTETVLSLEQEGRLTRLQLSPLGHDDLGELAATTLARRPSPVLVDWLAERSRGNPLFALGLLRALAEEGANLDAPSLSSFPEELAERVDFRLRRLDEPALATAEMLAVLGRQAGLSELSRLTARPVERLGLLLDRLVRDRLVAEVERPPELGYEIAHPLIQEAIYRRIGSARRRALHRLLARRLVDDGRRADAASHYARSADTGDGEAIEALTEAVREAEAHGSHREAMAILESLLEILPAGDVRWLNIVDAMAWDAEWVMDHKADAVAEPGIRALEKVEALLSGTDDSRLGMVLFRLASFLAWGRGDLARAEEMARRAHYHFERADDAARARIVANELAWLRGLGGDLSARAHEEVLTAARAVSDGLVTAHALGAFGWSASLQGRFAEAEQSFRESTDLARSQRKPYRVSWSLSSLALALALEGRLQEAEPLIEEAKEANPDYADAVLLEANTTIRWLAGDFRGAIASWLESAAWNSGGRSCRRGWAAAVASIAAGELGSLEEAQHYLEHAALVYGDRGFYSWSQHVDWARGFLGWRTGTAGALVDLRRGADSWLAIGARPNACFALLDLAETAAALQQPERARPAARQLAEVAASVDRPLYSAIADLGRAWAELVARSWTEASSAALSASGVFAAAGYRAFEARALEALGRALAQGDRSAAAECLGQAADLFGDLEVGWRRERCLAMLKQLGEPGRRRALISSSERLSARELEVARLAAGGLTARDIGQRLFIGERTVETHLANVYTKLGLESKRELVQRAAELGLARGTDSDSTA